LGGHGLLGQRNFSEIFLSLQRCFFLPEKFFCSQRCYGLSITKVEKVTFKCDGCGKESQKAKYLMHTGKAKYNFCSNTCEATKNKDEKKCSKCEQAKSLKYFSKNKQIKGGIGPVCRTCTNTASRNRYRGLPSYKKPEPKECLNCKKIFGPTRTVRQVYCSTFCYNKSLIRILKRKELVGRTRDCYLKRKYGISFEEKEKMVKSQKEKCLLCKRKLRLEKDLLFCHVDHNHKNAEIRGILCPRCNSHIINVVENNTIDLLQKAFSYLNLPYKIIPIDTPTEESIK